MTPTDAYRGAGRPEAAYAIERAIDSLARKLEMDPAEVRRKNFYEPFDEPTETPAGLQYDSMNMQAALDRVIELADYEGLREEQRRRRENNDPVQLGIGFSTYTEICGLGPSKVLAGLGIGGAGWEAASVRMLLTGKVEVATGTSPHGQGHETSWAQITADALGVTPDDVVVLHGDTAISPMGRDTYGSRSLAVGGIAVHLAAQKVVEKAKKIAAHMLEAAEGDIEFEGGKFSVAGSPDQNVTIQDVSATAFLGANIPEGMEPGLSEETVFDPPNFTFPFGAHLCVTEVDTETGFTKIRDYFAVDDCGPVINPVIVDGQLHGGLAQGIAQALYEEAVYDENGNLVTGSMVDYLVPGAPELAELHPGAHRHAVAFESIRSQGRGRGGDHRGAAGGRQLGDRRPLAARGHAHRHADLPVERVADDPGRSGQRGRQPRRGPRRAPVAGNGQRRRERK